jgi:hypothetical protein
MHPLVMRAVPSIPFFQKSLQYSLNSNVIVFGDAVLLIGGLDDDMLHACSYEHLIRLPFLSAH